MKKLPLPALVISLFLPVCTQAASFDCTTAAATIEKLICSDEITSKLDSDLAEVYKAAMEKSENKEVLKRQHNAWLNETRNVCNNKICIKNVYQERINILNTSESALNLKSDVYALESPIVSAESLEEDITIELSSLSDFEKMLFGFSTCNFKDLYFDSDSEKPDNNYFKNKNLKPSIVNDDMAIYFVREKFHGINVYKLTIPHYFPVVEIGFDAPLSVVIEKLSPFLNNGFYKSYPENVEAFDRPLIMKDRNNPEKTTLTCD